MSGKWSVASWDADGLKCVPQTLPCNLKPTPFPQMCKFTAPHNLPQLTTKDYRLTTT
jgi:hypothetical protein